VKHVVDYPTASKAPYEMEFRGSVPISQRTGYPNKGQNLRADTAHWAMKEDEQPIVQEKPFRWYRGYHTGGKSLMWARQTQRWSDLDFEGPIRDNFAIDWPIRYADIAPWYSHVEKFVGIAGDNDNIPELPNSVVQPGFELSCVEEYYKSQINKHYGENRRIIKARCAHLTAPEEVHLKQGRTACQNQTMCNRGCNFGGYFSSNSSTLPWAQKTGNLTLRPHSVVHSIIYDDRLEKVTGVRIVDSQSKKMQEYFAKVIFVNASTLNSNMILLNSKSNRFPQGLGNDNGLLGKYISWHNYRGHASAKYDGMLDKKTSGRSPTNAYMPRFRNLFKQETDFLRGYAIGVYAGRNSYSDSNFIGEELTDSLLNPQLNNHWNISTWMMGECVPVEENHVRLHESLVDKYGIPQLILSCDWTDNDVKMVNDFVEQSKEMFQVAGFTDIKAEDTKSLPGSDIHEMGGVRMGHDPKNSLLNKWNQLHHAKNVFVTDGACMVSTGTQNPTLTFMALTARAADYAIQQLKTKNL
jgi:choline dehydrogenase-like flavoprotein